MARLLSVKIKTTTLSRFSKLRKVQRQIKTHHLLQSKNALQTKKPLKKRLKESSSCLTAKGKLSRKRNKREKRKGEQLMQQGKRRSGKSVSIARRKWKLQESKERKNLKSCDSKEKRNCKRLKNVVKNCFKKKEN